MKSILQMMICTFLLWFFSACLNMHSFPRAEVSLFKSEGIQNHIKKTTVASSSWLLSLFFWSTQKPIVMIWILTSSPVWFFSILKKPWYHRCIEMSWYQVNFIWVALRLYVIFSTAIRHYQLPGSKLGANVLHSARCIYLNTCVGTCFFSLQSWYAQFKLAMKRSKKV